ncbi:hypothetical protein SAMN05421739_10230 [Pontibacter chinhatensis]|uniref:Uncharacterized protein n=1 Tax=Pontibacter chinhatensis TaxID=1436961 RepID=A0A1I2QRX4_9BACT|nr:hypothetical protein SAMN05421739_10230 [Pontibacter chinhatensis]
MQKGCILEGYFCSMNSIAIMNFRVFEGEAAFECSTLTILPEDNSGNPSLNK